MKSLFKNDNFINALLISLGGLLVINLGIAFYAIKKLEASNKAKQETDFIKQHSDNIIHATLDVADLGVRGYALTKNEQFLGYLQSAEDNKEPTFKALEAMLEAQQYDLFAFHELKQDLGNYLGFCRKMTEAARKDSMKLFTRMLNEDRGFNIWMKHKTFNETLQKFEDQLYEKAENDYLKALWANRIIQGILFLLGIPLISFIVFRLRKEREQRKKLLTELDFNNRKYMFDNGIEAKVNDPREITDSSIKNFHAAGQFVKNISEGNYAAEWSGFGVADEKRNETTLAGRLVKMRDRLKLVKAEEEKRAWTNEGLSTFSEIVRNNQDELSTLGNEAVKFLTKYLKAQQGWLFVLVEEEGEKEAYLELAACFAFDKKKFAEKRIAPGDGIIGQVFLEGQTTQLNHVPQGYTYITSGLGHATPDCMIIVPMKYNDKTEAVIELASFEKFESHQVDFVEKAGQFLASALTGVKTRSRTQTLLEESQQQAEAMRAGEEEMRQNMEELQATQEEMNRAKATSEMLLVEQEQQVLRLKAKEEELQKANDEMENIRRMEKERATTQINSQKDMMARLMEKQKQTEQALKDRIKELEGQTINFKHLN